MYSFMKSHAAKNIWCNPEQDNQLILEAIRITSKDGNKVSTLCMGDRITLPRDDRYYQVFQIGQIRPNYMGLLSHGFEWEVPTWISFDHAMTVLPLFADIYTDLGEQIPLHRCYYMFTREKAFIFAIDIDDLGADYYKGDTPYLRLYTNEYYNSDRSSVISKKTSCTGLTLSGRNDITDVNNDINVLKALPGQVLCYINGNHVDRIDASNAFAGDTIEYKYDESIKSVFDFRVSSLKSFLSTLDSVRKYLVHPTIKSDQIDYIDDIDVYILSKNASGFTGRYFHRNALRSIRMVTHQDYAVSVDEFEVIAQGLADSISESPMDLREFFIRVYVRNSGMYRPLTYDNQRIFELYKLSDERIVESMVGLSANVSVWKAENLESSGYTEVMRTRERNIDIALIQKAYGYNAISRAIGESPLELLPSGGSMAVSLPVAYQRKATVYEYDADGILLDSNVVTNSLAYFTANLDAKAVEIINGEGSHSPSVSIGTDNLAVPLNCSYRVYKCLLVSGVPDNNWQDITETNLYTVVNNKVIWSVPDSNQWLMVRSDEKFLSYSIGVPLTADVLSFELTEYIGGALHQMHVPMDNLTIWLNKKKLIKNLDYFVTFPKVVIVCKEHLLQPTTTEIQVIDIRFTGLCSSDLKMRDAEDYGFVQHGFLSNNSRFDIHDDKVLEITVRGKMKFRDQIKFSEEHSGISVVNALNGSPYQVKEVIVPIHELSEKETYDFRELALEIDEEVGAYMSTYLPQPPRNAVSSISARYVLVSPFFAHIVNDLSNERFDMSKINKQLSDTEIIAICAPYEDLLVHDPLNVDNHIDQNYVVIHPTSLYSAIGLSLDSYRFLQNVVRLYGRGLISLSPHLVVSL